MTICIIISIFSYFLRYFFPHFPLSEIAFLVFIIIQSKRMRRTLSRLKEIIENIWGIFLLEFLCILITAFVIRLYTFGELYNLNYRLF